MFWKKKKKPAPPEGGGKPTREEIIAQARVNMAAARAEIGDETLDKIKDALMKKQQSAIEQAKAQIKASDMDKVRDHLSLWLEEDRKK